MVLSSIGSTCLTFFDNLSHLCRTSELLQIINTRAPLTRSLPIPLQSSDLPKIKPSLGRRFPTRVIILFRIRSRNGFVFTILPDENTALSYAGIGTKTFIEVFIALAMI